jgi:rhodanese-related sulfurtransferase
MKKKIPIITIFMLIILPISGILGTAQISTQPTQSINTGEDVTISLTSAPLFAGINLEITNNGETEITDIPWYFKAKPTITGAGLLRTSTINQGVIPTLAPGETTTIEFRPLQAPRSPIGFATTYINATIQIGDETIRAQQQALLVFIFLIGNKNTYIDITPAETYAMFLNNTFDLIIDVVGLDIYSLGHLPGAVNYVWADGTLNQEIPNLDKNLTYLVYCHTDPPSTASAQALVDAGIPKTYRLEGNYAAWTDAGYPIET